MIPGEAPLATKTARSGEASGQGHLPAGVGVAHHNDRSEAYRFSLLHIATGLVASVGLGGNLNWFARRRGLQIRECKCRSVCAVGMLLTMSIL